MDMNNQVNLICFSPVGVHVEILITILKTSLKIIN